MQELSFTRQVLSMLILIAVGIAGKIVKIFLAIKGVSLAATPVLSPFAASGRSVLQRASLNLTSAQILLLETTPVTLIPAPGAGLQIVPYFILIHFFGGSVAYTNAGGAVSVSVGATWTKALSELFTVTVSPNRQVAGFDLLTTELSSSAANPPDTDNAPMTISKATNQYAAGNGTARVTVYYTIEPTA